MPVCMYAMCKVLLVLSFQVWTEARVGTEWIHIDPCEAAVDEPLIYQGWGKNQTFIFAYKKESEKSPSGLNEDEEFNTAGMILVHYFRLLTGCCCTYR